MRNREKAKLYNKSYYQNNKEVIKERSKKYYNNHKQTILYVQNEYRMNNKNKIVNKSRKQNLKFNYNLSLEDYNSLFKKQHGCCLICGKHQTELQKNLHVDHDHLSGEVRGLLCPRCNMGLGYFETWYQKYKQSITIYLTGYKK